MKRLSFIFSVPLMLSLLPSVHALNVGEISSFMESDNSRLSKEIKNTTDSGRLINIRVERISSPLESGTVIPMESQDEILMSPASLILPGNASDIIRFYYKGPNDDKERYYRIIWLDQALSGIEKNSATRSAVATTSARIGTILVVAPRKDNFNYRFINNKIENTGNSTFKTVAYGKCNQPSNLNDCKEDYFVMPGMSFGFSRVNISDKKSRVALWHGEQFIPVK